MGAVLDKFNPSDDPEEDDGEKKDEDEKKEEKQLPKTLEQELRYYVMKGDEEKIRVIVQQGADVNCRDMGEIAERVKMEELEAKNSGKQQKAKKKDDDTHDPFKNIHDRITEDTPLHIAVENNQIKTIGQLFYLGARMDVTNRIGSTAFHHAVGCDNLEAAAELLKLGADIHARNKIGNTALHIAATTGSVKMLEWLLQNGAQSDIQVMNKVYMTPVEYTQKNSPSRDYLIRVFPQLKQLFAEEELLEQQQLLQQEEIAHKHHHDEKSP